MERELDRLSLALKPRDLVHRVIFPFLKEVGDEVHAERLNIAQEHLLSGAVRNLLGAMVRMYSKNEVSRRLLFATPSGERHEFGVLAAAMLAAAGGLGVVYLGADLPARLIVDSAARSGVDVVVLGIIYSGSTRELRRQVDYIVDHLPGRLELWVGGHAHARPRSPAGGPADCPAPGFRGARASARADWGAVLVFPELRPSDSPTRSLRAASPARSGRVARSRSSLALFKPPWGFLR